MVLDFDAREVNSITVVDLEGKMTTSTSADAEVFLQELLDDGVNQLVLNLESVDFIASTGLRVILSTGKKLMAKSGKMVICNLNPTVAEVFKISGFSQMFSVFDSEEEALSSF